MRRLRLARLVRGGQDADSLALFIRDLNVPPRTSPEGAIQLLEYPASGSHGFFPGVFKVFQLDLLRVRRKPAVAHLGEGAGHAGHLGGRPLAAWESRSCRKVVVGLSWQTSDRARRSGSAQGPPTWFSSVASAVMTCAGTKGLDTMTLLGTPLAAHSWTLSPLT